jgi:hypothetical protein
VNPGIWGALSGARVLGLWASRFFLAPLCLLSTKPDEFATPPDVIVWIALVCVAGATIVITLASTLLLSHVRNVVASRFTIMAPTVYVQAYQPAGSYGQIDISDLDISGTRALSAVELPLWICVIPVGGSMAVRIAALRVHVLAGVLLAQPLTLAMIVSNVDWVRKHSIALGESGKYKSYRMQNLLVIVMVAFQSNGWCPTRGVNQERW